MIRPARKRNRALRTACLAVGVATVATAPAASASDLCVGNGGNGRACYRSIQDAVDAAKAGDRIRLGAGTHKGGVAIDVSVTLIGAGANRTVIRGGGPVLTIGTFGATREPSVTISGVKITGGVTRSSPQSEEFTGEKGVFAVGGGVEVPPNKAFDGAATLTIRNSVITGNRVMPRTAVRTGPPCPGDRRCSFAFAGGGGIDTWGDLTLVDSTVRGNRVGAAAGLAGPTSDADGGGIASRGSLTLTRSRVIENRATATAPSGRFAEGGGIYAPAGAVTLRHSTVSRNRAVLRTSFPGTVDLLAIGGGLQLADDVTSIRIDDTRIAHNTATATNAIGDVEANSGAINFTNVETSFRMKDAVLAHNRIRAVALSHRHGNALVDSGAATLAGVVARTLITDNSATARSRGGDATASGGGVLMFGRMIESEVSDNSVSAKSPRGRARAAGGGLEVDYLPLTLRRTEVAGNSASAVGRRGFALGGGIFDWKLFSTGARLALVGASVQGNTAEGTDRVQGGGIYARNRPVKSAESVISGNAPDQCFGC